MTTKKSKTIRPKKMPCCKDAAHPDHSDEIKKLNRVLGQVKGIQNMIAERRYCPDILMQMRAAKAALTSVEASILERHMQSCLRDALHNPKDAEKKIGELAMIFRKNL